MESARSDILRFVDLYVSKSTIQEPGKFERGKMKFVSVTRELSKFLKMFNGERSILRTDCGWEGGGGGGGGGGCRAIRAIKFILQ